LADWSPTSGWARHSIFGLRQEWLELYLSKPREWRLGTTLGNRQLDSLAMWLRTGGVEDRMGRQTALGKQFAMRGTAYSPLWELLWANVVSSFPTARWYVHLGTGAWTTTQLKAMLREAVLRLADRTVSNAITELVGLLERTPIGSELGQGEVSSERPRRVTRRGRQPGDAAILHYLQQLCLQQDGGRLEWSSPLTWPWTVFGCSREFVLERLTALDREGLIEVDEHGVTLHGGWQQCTDTRTS